MDNAIIDILHIPHSKCPSSLPPILARDSAWLDILTFAKRLLHGDYDTALLQGFCRLEGNHLQKSRLVNL